MIVLADQDHVLSSFLTPLIEQAGYKVQVVREPHSAYQYATSDVCSGLILDVSNPGLYAMDLLMLLLIEKQSIPVIAMTSRPESDEKTLMQYKNVKKICSKPVHLDEIVDAVREHVG